MPSLSKESIRAQIQHIVDTGWKPGIEHDDQENARRNYWGKTDADAILAEIENSHKAYPDKCSSAAL
jgi:ribulose-bisphosphate carboxylase small chain